MRVIVAGMIAQFPLGGVAWDYLQYVIGLERLGYDVYYYEDSSSWPYHPVEQQYVKEGAYSANLIGDFFNRYVPRLNDHWHYFHLHNESFGMTRAEFNDIARTADLFINVSGACLIPDGLSPQCVKVFLDTDPGYNQVVFSERFAWSDNVQEWCLTVADHDQYFTYAENINSIDCLIPKISFEWKTTRMPIVMDLWDPLARIKLPRGSPWTTVMTWNAFRGKLIYKGEEYESKGREFDKLIDLPNEISTPLKIAVGGNHAPIKQLEIHGWRVVDGPNTTLSPDDYQTFIAESRGELSIAKHVYVAMRSGWFSCRSACYLAASRPVVVQDTGFTDFIPTGRGLFAFKDLAEAKEALLEIEGDYASHQAAAHEIARDYFSSDVVLRDLLKKSGLR